ncbi:oxidoreductase [Ameyamaea chiangmaiensis NBRC 103196]|uniref:SDR family oxidoreductase n=1 Tax=Ameyamaea chiangmaiensis TaxID=442969 RepID=A0A850PBF4_9PROT|nr:SDR family oxidoreductase [Ameyamaea chiangmaiensis]MBS4076540.1 SDR family oxidoreductase [Ameyamaea chiangmaiensis]NVN40009.1 SDR family oxidoreductase [Ameyamaea chiangmaiensis]GBQ62064.1 oxidoreductase [Ameyamaea chiangmaiensis NBRC 103196]
MPAAKTIALVTGGSRGLGRSTVEALARRGVSSIFTYHANRAAADEVVGTVEHSGARAVALQLDTSNISAFPPFLEEVRTVLGEWGAERFDYLVNMAGTSHSGPFGEVTEEDFDAAYRVHVKGPFFLTQTLLPLIADGGRIVNISSGLTRFTYPGRIVYASMKGAVEVMTHYMARELGPRRIAVNTVAPGAIQTDFSGGAVRDNPEVARHIAEATALGRPGLPDDIGPMIASLLSEDNRWVNAQRIEVSGGQCI